jgi:site-specific recombinase XerC
MRRDPATGNPDLFSYARDYLHVYMPRVRALSPKTVEAYRISLECFLGYLAETEHVQREHVAFDHFDRPHLRAWLAWMTGQRHYAPKTVALRLSAVKAFLAYAAQEDITLIALSQAAGPSKPRPSPASPSATSPRPRYGRSWPRTQAGPPSPAATGCCSSCFTTPRRACRRSPP